LTIKLLVLDIDGTIAGKSNTINPTVVEAIKQLIYRGIQVTLATGRMYRSALKFQQQINSKLPLIVYNGALIKDPLTEDVKQHIPVDVGVARELINYLEDDRWRDNLAIHFYLNDCLYVREVTPTTKVYADRSRVEAIAVGDLRQLLDSSPTKILAIGDCPQLITDLLTKLPQLLPPDRISLTQSTATFLEATNPQANKGKAVRYLAETILGLVATEVMTIGDNLNDLEMLRYAGIGVAMGNAPDKLKEAADWVTLDVENDGVIVAIDRFIGL
jgi:Cof subfamily protein (haloacid dehalogenase superfamily)